MKPVIKLVTLFLLYFVQGLPYGFYSIALPLYLRSAGMSLTLIGSTSFISLPWVFKALWSPLIDRQKGGRKAWIIPTQLGMAVCSAIAAFFPITAETDNSLFYFLYCVWFTMNLCAATQDVAVDGLAIDLTDRTDLGPANAFQVIGFKCGMFMSGLLIVQVGWTAQFLIMSATTVGVLLWVHYILDEAAEQEALRLNNKTRKLEAAEKDSKRSNRGGGTHRRRIAEEEEALDDIGNESDTESELSFGQVLQMVLHFLRLPVGRYLLLLVATYKIGDTLIGTMLKPFFVDLGIPKGEVAVWFGSFGLFTSIAGSFLGGLMAAKMRFRWALLASAVLRLPTTWLIYWLASSNLSVSFMSLYQTGYCCITGSRFIL